MMGFDVAILNLQFLLPEIQHVCDECLKLRRTRTELNISTQISLKSICLNILDCILASSVVALKQTRVRDTVILKPTKVSSFESMTYRRPLSRSISSYT